MEPEDGRPSPGGRGHLQRFRMGFLEETVLCMADFSNAVVTTPFGRRLASVTAPPSGVLCSVMLPSGSHSLAFLLPFVL